MYIDYLEALIWDFYLDDVARCVLLTLFWSSSKLCLKIKFFLVGWQNKMPLTRDGDVQTVSKGERGLSSLFILYLQSHLLPVSCFSAIPS